MSEIKRVFLIGVDSLIYKRTSMGGAKLNVCPTLKRLSDEGINCSNNYSHSGPTQFSLPSVFTSSLPLDYNGYDKGIIDRPNSLVEILRQEGFETFGTLSNTWTSELGGYDRGFDSTTDGYSIDTVWASASIYINYFNERLSNGDISLNERDRLVLNHVEKLLAHTRVYCEKVIHESGKFNNDEKFIDIYKYNFKNILQLIPERIATAAHAEEILANLIGLYGLPKRLQPLFHKNFASADWMFDSILARLDQSQAEKTMSFTFLEDPHELNTCRGHGSYLRANANSLLASIPSSERYRRIYKYFDSTYRDVSSSILYDASVKYVDDSLERFIEGLKIRSILDESLIIIFSDHGTSFNNSFNPASFEEDYLNVPMIFWSSHMKPKNIHTLTSLMDLAPTTLELLNIEIPETYRGIPVIDSGISSRGYIIHENAGRGPCDIPNKKLYVGLRDQNSVLWMAENNEINHSFKKIIADREVYLKEFSGER